jgi:hypothetical protein
MNLMFKIKFSVYELNLNFNDKVNVYDLTMFNLMV